MTKAVIFIGDSNRMGDQATVRATLRDDSVHFTPEGCTLLGKAVAACLRQYHDRMFFTG